MRPARQRPLVGEADVRAPLLGSGGERGGGQRQGWQPDPHQPVNRGQIARRAQRCKLSSTSAAGCPRRCGTPRGRSPGGRRGEGSPGGSACSSCAGRRVRCAARPACRRRRTSRGGSGGPTRRLRNRNGSTQPLAPRRRGTPRDGPLRHAEHPALRWPAQPPAAPGPACARAGAGRRTPSPRPRRCCAGPPSGVHAGHLRGVRQRVGVGLGDLVRAAPAPHAPRAPGCRTSSPLTFCGPVT